MVRDAELAARDYVALVCNGLPAETDINLVIATLAQARTARRVLRRPGLGADRRRQAQRASRRPLWQPPSRAADTS